MKFRSTIEKNCLRSFSLRGNEMLFLFGVVGVKRPLKSVNKQMTREM